MGQIYEMDVWQNWTSVSSVIQFIVDFLLQLKISGLSITSIKAQLATIAVYIVLIDNKSVFTHNAVKKCMKGLVKMYPLMDERTSSIMGSQFSPISLNTWLPVHSFIYLLNCFHSRQGVD